MKFLKSLKSFLSIILSNWIGASVGLFVGLVFSLILDFTAFKNNKFCSVFFSIIFCIVFAFCGIFVQNQFFKKDNVVAISSVEQITNIDASIKKGWTNTNGGFSFNQIIASQSDDTCPIVEDQIISLTCHDFGSYICFSFDNNGLYQNIVFVKTDNGLIIDGLLNMSAEMKGGAWYGVGTKFEQRDANTFKWIDNRNNIPEYIQYYDTQLFFIKTFNHDNLVSASRGVPFFLKNCYDISPKKKTKTEIYNYAMTMADELIGQNASENFIKFGNVELIGTKDTGMIKINSFYNYLFEQLKGVEYNGLKIIDGSSSLCYPIPEKDQTMYPIPSDKLLDYATVSGDISTAPKYYGVYKTNIAIEVKYVKGNQMLSKSINFDDYIDKIVNNSDTKHKVSVEPVTSQNDYSKLKLQFKNVKDNLVEGINLQTKPIKIQFTCNELNQTKIIEINSLEKLNNGVDCILNKNVEWNYVIDSPELIFEDFLGSFKVTEALNNISFDYYYLQNYIVATVGLNPIGTIDMSQIDLFENPVKIILSNDNHTYQFVFSDNSDLNLSKSMLVEMGEYNYTILSKQLLFANVTGKLTITTTDKHLLFNYAIGSDEALTFKVTLEDYTTTSNCFSLFSRSSNVALIRDTLSSAKVYTVTCVIYDKDGKLMETFNHTHSSTGSCGETWYSSNLVVGQTYTLQLRFADRDDSSITYLSDITDFVYNGSTGYKVVYNVTKNN